MVFTVEKSSVEAMELHKEHYFSTNFERFYIATDYDMTVMS